MNPWKFKNCEWGCNLGLVRKFTFYMSSSATFWTGLLLLENVAFPDSGLDDSCNSCIWKFFMGRGKSAECKGLVSLISSCGFVQEFKDTEGHLNFNAAKVVLEGCGCFRLFERRGHRGKSYLVNQNGKQNVPLRRVRSMAKIKCPGKKKNFAKKTFIHGSPTWVMIHYKRTQLTRKIRKKNQTHK